jgi:hypothetical protein
MSALNASGDGGTPCTGWAANGEPSTDGNIPGDATAIIGTGAATTTVGPAAPNVLGIGDDISATAGAGDCGAGVTAVVARIVGDTGAERGDDPWLDVGDGSGGVDVH